MPSSSMFTLSTKVAETGKTITSEYLFRPIGMAGSAERVFYPVPMVPPCFFHASGSPRQREEQEVFYEITQDQTEPA